MKNIIVEEQATYQPKINVIPFEPYNVDSINQGIQTILLHHQKYGFQNLNDKNSLSFCLNFMSRKLQLIGMQEQWSEKMREEFLLLDKLTCEIKDLLKPMLK